MALKNKLILFCFIFITSCSCGTPLEVSPIQKDDKKLACKDVILEINEAEHYRDEGLSAQGISLSEALMPTCWASGYMDGAKAVKAANSRIDYLGQIYDLLDCGGKADESNSASSQPPAAMAIPAASIPFTAPAFAPTNPNFGQAAPQGGNFPMQRPNDTSHYQSKGNDVNKYLHEHKDSQGRIYVHSHPHQGPHRHIEDE